MPRGDGGRILVFGDLIDDVIVVPGAPIRPDTDTPSAIRTRAGGSAANTAAWLAAAGADVTFTGRTGEGDAARHAALLEAAGVRARVQDDPALPTGTIVVIVEGDRRSMLTERGANAALSPDEIDPSGFDLVHATGYSLVGHAEAFAGLVARAHAAGALISLNAGSVAAIDEVGLEAFLSAAAEVDILIATAEEAADLTGRTEPRSAAEALAERHALVAVTAGTAGAWLASAHEAWHVPAEQVQAADPTGAGDAFTAGLLAALVAGDDPHVAGQNAARLAAEAVATVGGRPHNAPRPSQE